MFRGDRLVILALTVLLMGGCKGGKDNAAAGPAVDPEVNQKITEEEDALMGRRDALFNMRRDLKDKRAALAKQREEILASGGDPSEVDAKAKELLSEEEKLADQELELNKTYEEILRQRREMMAALSTGAGAAGGDVAGREAGIAAREKEMARRERTLAEREAALAKREENLATKWKEECAVGGVTTQTIVKTVDVKGSSYTKKDVEPLLAKARKEMSKKGLLASDLPEQVRGLEKEANEAMKDGDFGRARLAANQLYGTVRATKIDKAFIAAKIQRLNQRMRGKKLSGDKQKRAEGLFREATSLYGDAKFKKANSKLNQIFGLLR